MTLPPLLAALLAGYLLSPYALLPVGAPMAGAAALLLGGSLVVPLRWRRIVACAGVLLLALVLAESAQRPPDDPQALHRFCGEERVSLTGEVLAVGRSSSGNLYLDLESERLVNHGLEAVVRGRMRLYLEAREAPFTPGDRLAFVARLRRPRAFGAPGEFDYPRYLAHRRIFVVASLRNVGDIAPLGQRRDPTLLERWRRVNAASICDALVDRPELAGLVRALAQGERSEITREQRELLAASGLSHLFAISGLHFALVATALYAVGLGVWRRLPWLLERASPRRFLPLLLVPPLYLYLALSGEAISSVRAFLGLAAGALLLASLRRVAPLRLLAAIAFVLLVSDPLLFYDVSFQLSFAAAAGLLAVMPRLHPRLRPLPAWLRYPALTAVATVTATLATFPLVLLHFRLVAPGALPANLLAVPLISLAALPLALTGVVLAPWWPAGAGLAFRGCGLLLGRLLTLAEGVSAWPGLSALVWWPSPAQLFGVAVAVVLAFWLVARGPRPTWLALGLLATGLLFAIPDRTPLAVTVLSVGQGESVLLSFSGGRHVLVDTGGLAGSDFDVGERLVVPALARLGVRRLEAVVLTHAHPDHLLGLAAVVEHVPVASLWTAVADRSLPDIVHRRVADGRLTLQRPSPGWQAPCGDGLPLALFAPPQLGEENDRSLVAYARSGAAGVLLSGDLGRRGVEELLRAPAPGPVTLLKLPHHGSRHSAQARLLEAFAPHQAVVSAGAGNRFGLPHAETLALYAAAGIPIWRTDLHGTLRLRTDGGGWRVTRWKEGRFVDMPVAL